VSGSDRWLFVSDVDHTLTGDEATLARLSEALRAAAGRIVLAYNSSRPCASVRQTLAAMPQMAVPDYLAGAMGTELQQGALGQPVAGYARHFDHDWHDERIRALATELGFEPHPEEFQTRFKASYDVPNAEAVRQIRRRLEGLGLEAKVVYSGGKDLDVIPRSAGKGAVVRYLQSRLQIDAHRVVVAGDSANDREMFVDPYRGIVVANASPALKEVRCNRVYHAASPHAGGVLEGLRFWGAL
jgi:sucrose-6F-phosphate phosphohydrolase